MYYKYNKTIKALLHGSLRIDGFHYRLLSLVLFKITLRIFYITIMFTYLNHDHTNYPKYTIV